MIRRVALVLVVATLFTSSLFAGLTYDFKSTSEGTAGGQLAGKASLEGENLRMDVAQGDGIIFKDDSVVLSNDGGETLLVLDPRKKTYFELPITDLMAASGTMLKAMGGMIKFSIKNPKVAVRETGDGGSIEGYPTTRYVIDTDYDMSLTVMGMKNDSKVHSSSEIWTTSKLGEEPLMFLQQRSVRTGIEELDEILSEHAKAMRGFPLKHVTRTVTTAKNGKTQTVISTVTISNIQKRTVAPAQFELPKGYRELEMPLPGLPQ